MNNPFDYPGWPKNFGQFAAAPTIISAAIGLIGIGLFSATEGAALKAIRFMLFDEPFA
ncbi:hypothetical protein [Methylocystis heyeri]|uniref:Uncharacterized protein n=1 Tax=Methylocystis heyeri TaxID=391905 RepID=A0A6B8KE80_9HYPH|nr:hypothetical protein [Methylocystis heyeri]QGM45999.1 hypothetical protein H2LOC_009955 [Methylocystis heyeri]